MPLQIGHDTTTRNTLMPISKTNRRLMQSAKAERDRSNYAPSAHHLRQMAKLSTSGGTIHQKDRSDALETQKQLHHALKGINSASHASPLVRPQSSGAFKARKIEKTCFRYFYDRGDLPVRINFCGAVRKLQWQVEISTLDYSHYLPLFMEGLRELEEPYHFIALQGTMDMLERGETRPLACLPLLVLPMKQNLMTRNQRVVCLQMRVLQQLVRSCPFVGEALVPYYRQLLSIFNLFITKRVNCGDQIDYSQRKQENLGDLIAETLNLMERHGGPDAFVNIKRMNDPFPRPFISSHIVLTDELPASAMKKRPVLTVNATEHALRPPSKPKPQLSISNDDSNGSEDEDDALETSCDIGETTFRKGQMQINRTGVIFTKINHHQSKPDDAKEVEDDFDAEQQPKKRRTHILLDELEVCGVIGRGCSGHVMKAQHIETNEWFAIKVVNNVYDKVKRNQLLTEIRTLYSVESPFLVDFYGAYFKDHALSIVLEFCDVGSLDKLIQQRGPIPEKVIAAMAFQMLQGLHHLKKTHHFHRDIKPQNILVQKNGTIKLTDFGIARALGNSQDMAQTFVGTFKYMSPERVQNEPYEHVFFYKSDIWSFGLVFIECATTLFPYRSARSYIDVVQSIIESPAPELPANDRKWSFSSEFREFLGDCLKKDAKKRASVEKLLNSSWFQLHQATDGPTCTKRCAAWLKDGAKKDAEVDDDEIYEDDYEIEEEIEDTTYRDEK